MVRTPIRFPSTPSQRLLAGGAAALSVVAFAGCGGSASESGSGSSSSGGGATLAVTAVDYGFQPASLSIPSGGSVTVTLKNTGKVEHSFTLDDNSASVDADGGETKTLTFTAPQSGSIGFHCKYHPNQMKGTIAVGGTGGAGAGGSSSTSSSSGYNY